MKFGDKLIELRKKKGYSQEELAEKLGVSRQSVSKWESNNTYPETDKIIQIANLFDCSMDDLINDKVTDIEGALRKNKGNIYNVWDSLLEFITKTVNMFSKMRFQDGLRCIIELFILGLLLSILGKILSATASAAIANIFTFIGGESIIRIKEILKGIFGFVWFIIAVITMVHTFKIRYLNYYNDEKTEESVKKNEKENIKNKEKVIIRDEKPFEFLGFLSKIVIIFIKFITAWIIISIICGTLALLFVDVLSISLLFTNIMFLWSTLLFTSMIVIAIQITIILLYFIFNKDIHLVRNIIIFISCIIISGISIGFLTLSIKNLTFIKEEDAFDLKYENIDIEYKDDLVVKGTSDKYKYIIDNSIKDNKIIVSRKTNPEYFELYTTDTSINKIPVIKVKRSGNDNMRGYYDLFVKYIKQNKVFSINSYGEDPLIIKANDNTINKLKNNLKKLYLIEEKSKNGTTIITTKMDRVYFPNGLEGEYNVKDDTIRYNADNYSCNKDIEKTEYGEKIIYTCNYKEEN